MAIWGNHSSTLYPDFFNARINGKPATECIEDRRWLETDFIKAVQQRGAAVIPSARGLFGEVRGGTRGDRDCGGDRQRDPGRRLAQRRPMLGRQLWHRKGLICSFPTRSDGSQVTIVQGVPINDFSRRRSTQRSTS